MSASAAYSLLPWQTFFAAEVGAAASLTGLLFVAVSINLRAILSFPRLPARAGETLMLLLLVAVISSLALTPQSPRALAAEIIVSLNPRVRGSSPWRRTGSDLAV